MLGYIDRDLSALIRATAFVQQLTSHGPYAWAISGRLPAPIAIRESAARPPHPSDNFPLQSRRVSRSVRRYKVQVQESTPEQQRSDSHSITFRRANILFGLHWESTSRRVPQSLDVATGVSPVASRYQTTARHTHTVERDIERETRSRVSQVSPCIIVVLAWVISIRNAPRHPTVEDDRGGVAAYLVSPQALRAL